MHTPNETRPPKSQDQAAKEEVAENRYHDDRMYVLEIAESTLFKFPYDLNKGETRWSVKALDSMIEQVRQSDE